MGNRFARCADGDMTHQSVRRASQQASQQPPQQPRRKSIRPSRQPTSADSAVTSLSRPEEWKMSYENQQIDPPDEERIDSFALQRDTVQNALHLMASYLAAKGQNITIITVGGAISSLLLKDQLRRENLDYIVPNVSEEQRGILAAAARHGRAYCIRPMLGAWFSNRGDDTLKLPFSIHRQVVLKSLTQNEIIFQERGLKIIAAPWDYAFTATLGRLASHRFISRPHDLSDAIAYLRRYIQVRGDEPLTMGEVDFCARSYGIFGVETMASFVATRYFARYGHDGIVEFRQTNRGAGE